MEKPALTLTPPQTVRRIQHHVIGVVLPAALALGPLVGNPTRLLHPAPWISLLATIALLVLQPPLPPMAHVAKDSKDRGSALLIFAAIQVVTLSTVLDFGYRAALSPPPLSLWVLGGTGMIVLGTLLRFWAIRTLGPYFTGTVQTQAGQTVIDVGPYRHVRHPSYSALLLSFAGNAVLFESGLGAALTVLVALPAYLYRIRVEEKLLCEQIGEPYRRYQSRTGMLIPRLGRGN